MVADFVAENGFHVKYGDTDSLYLVCPERYFVDVHADFIAGKLTREEHWTAMVRITMRVLNSFRVEVNAKLAADNGTKYLNMAYEEVLYPVVFTGKKKYFGIPHMHVPNFYPKKLFVKGLDILKQGVSGLAVEVGTRVMWATMRVDNRKSLHDIVTDTVHEAVTNGSQWKFEHFIQTAAWKPEKNNLTVQRFMKRMRVRHEVEKAENARRVAAGLPRQRLLYEQPLPGDRFSYIITKLDSAYSLRGLKVTAKKGDRMEYVHAAKALGYEVDVGYYLVSYVVGLCARFVNYDPRYQPAAPGRVYSEKEIDAESQKAAKKALTTFINSISGADASMLRRRGYAYRRAHKAASAASRAELFRLLGPGAAVLDGDWLDFESFDPPEAEEADAAAADRRAPGSSFDPEARVVEQLWAAADRFAAHSAFGGGEADAWCRDVAARLGVAPNGSDSTPTSPRGRRDGPAVGLYAVAASAADAAAAPGAPRPRGRPTAGITVVFSRQLSLLEAETRRAMRAALPAVAEVAARYEADLTGLVISQRASEHAAHPDIGAMPAAEAAALPAAAPAAVLESLAASAAADRETVGEFRRFWMQAVGIQVVRHEQTAFADYLGRLKNKRTRATPRPAPAVRDALIAESAGRLVWSAHSLPDF
jgi:hypothetical protein